MSATVIRADARALPLADASVDLIVTSRRSGRSGRRRQPGTARAAAAGSCTGRPRWRWACRSRCRPVGPIDRSADYCRIATWRTNDPAQLAKAMRVPRPPVQADGQLDLFAEPGGTP